MIIESIKFQGHRCFKEGWSGFDDIKPVNVIIGRNNTGKSHLLDLVSTLCKGDLKKSGWEFLCSGKLDEESLKTQFRLGTSGGMLGGDFWGSHGQFFKEKNISWILDKTGNIPIESIRFESGFEPSISLPAYHAATITEARISGIRDVLLKTAKPILSGCNFKHLAAERDIVSAGANSEMRLESNGQGATNIIRRFLNSSSSAISRDLIQHNLLKALNEIFGNDGKFTEIQVKEHDDQQESGAQHGQWEIFLGQEKKGLIPLSRSGSGLKTIILVLLLLLVIPSIEKKEKKDYVFCFEELENNLHPSLLRRLFEFINKYCITEGAKVFLTTHASTALDFFGFSKDAQIIHVTHNTDSALATTVSAHFDKIRVVSELGAKPSDLLQANGIIWVEGPSDCIYINRWISLYSNGQIVEGRDYQCAFYGGALLSRTQFTSPEEAESDLVNLFRINPNIVVICDGDRAAEKARVKDRVRRIRGEVCKIPGALIWVTRAREIENYIPGNLIAKAFGLSSVPDPDRYEQFFPRKVTPNNSYVERRMKRKSIDKMELATLCAPNMELPIMSARFDLDDQMKQIIERINSWKK